MRRRDFLKGLFAAPVALVAGKAAQGAVEPEIPWVATTRSMTLAELRAKYPRILDGSLTATEVGIYDSHERLLADYAAHMHRRPPTPNRD